jgi:hypothetical protein
MADKKKKKTAVSFVLWPKLSTYRCEMEWDADIPHVTVFKRSGDGAYRSCNGAYRSRNGAYRLCM